MKSFARTRNPPFKYGSVRQLLGAGYKIAKYYGESNTMGTNIDTYLHYFEAENISEYLNSSSFAPYWMQSHKLPARDHRGDPGCPRIQVEVVCIQGDVVSVAELQVVQIYNPAVFCHRIPFRCNVARYVAFHDLFRDKMADYFQQIVQFGFLKLWKDSFSFQLTTSSEGLRKEYHDNCNGNQEEWNEKPSPISLDSKIALVFQIWLILLGWCCAAFVAECIFYKVTSAVVSKVGPAVVKPVFLP